MVSHLLKCLTPDSSDMCISDTVACTPDGVEKKCAFPFIHKGVTYNQCTGDAEGVSLWCSTKNDANNNNLPNEFGYCGPCQGVLN